MALRFSLLRNIGHFKNLCQTTLYSNRAFLVAQMITNPPAMQETWVQSLDWEDPLEKGTAAHSSILGWRIRPWGRKELDMTERLSL